MSGRGSPDPALTRREAVARLAWLLGGTIVGAGHFLNGTRARAAEASPAFTADERALVDGIADTIIPATDTPGATAAGVGAFMVMMATDCYDDEQLATLRSGLAEIDRTCRQQHGHSFLELSPDERTARLNQLNTEAPRYFMMLKQLTLLGYFTSEIGCTQALRYVETPGAFHGDVPYRKGDRAWASLPDAGLI